MPTFKNETARYIDYEAFVQDVSGEARKILIRFEPGEERGLSFWLPYQKLGLTLVNNDYPAVPSMILISGDFIFNNDTTRKFEIEPCDSYDILIKVKKGKVAMLPGNSTVCVEISENGEYKATLDWGYSPYLKITGLENNSVASIRAVRVYNERI